jgi:hypothetical protein
MVPVNCRNIQLHKKRDTSHNGPSHFYSHTLQRGKRSEGYFTSWIKLLTWIEERKAQFCLRYFILITIITQNSGSKRAIERIRMRRGREKELIYITKNDHSHFFLSNINNSKRIIYEFNNSYIIYKCRRTKYFTLMEKLTINNLVAYR